ncbi:MAG TPA: hypothetical protein PK109_01650, partial [Candidatus Paceibacterota bacterium]|nr:hypothetical protein [Candidatus Paceibacterota bacterium]
TEEFTFKVTFTPGEGGYDYRMQLLTIKFDTNNDTNGADNTTFTASPASDYETDFEFIAD